VPRFEVHVPAAPPARPAGATLRLEAEHWLLALKAGLDEVGGRMANVLCDVQADGSIHVTDTRQGGVFRIRELAVGEPAAGPAPAGARIGRAAAPAEDALAELAGRAAAARAASDRGAGLALLLDLAMERTGCEAGSVFVARPGGRELEFAVVRGPRADELLRLGITIPLGVGVVGFCARENVCLAVSDVEKDPRFHRAVSQAIGYATRSLLCAPAARGGRVLGALEVLNKRGGPFDPRDVAVLAHLAREAAELLARPAR
jgi:hypothetical protein